MCSECAESEYSQIKKLLRAKHEKDWQALLDSEEYKSADEIKKTGFRIAFGLKRQLHLDLEDHGIPS